MAAIVHSQMLKLYAGPRSISGSFGASPSQAAVTAYLSQPSCVLSANAEGVVEDYAPASTTIVVEVSGRTDTANWTISTTKSPSVGTVSVVGATISVSGMTDDAGWVDITASKAGYESVTRRFTLAKVRQKGGVRVATTLPANPSEVGGELAIFLDVADPALRGMYGWSGTAWVKTGELLNGSVTADKLAADAIQATKFADGIEPVSIVSLLPNVVGYTGPKLVFLTTDNKIYRYTGSSWVKELPAEDLTGQLVADQLASNSVTTGKIQAGAVTTDQLAAKAVTASKLVLTDTSNIYPDYDILDSSFYSGAAFTRVASTSLSLGAYALRIAANAAESRVESQWFQVEPSAEYFVELSAYQSISGTTGAAAAYIEFGSFSGGETTPTVTRSELVLRRVSTTSSARADAAVTTASNERKARLVFIREAGGTGVAEFGGPVIRRRNNAKLIVDGSIVATKIATDAVQTHHLLAGAVTAEKLMVNKLSAITADMGDVTAGTFTLSSTGYIRGGATNFSTGAGFWMGYDAGTYKLRAGTPGSSGFEWTGSAFNVRGPDGSITISSGVVDWAKINGTGKPENGATAGASLTQPFSNWNIGSQTLATVSDGKVGGQVLRLGTLVSYPSAQGYTPIDPTKKYRVRFWARPSSTCDGRLYFSLRQAINETDTWGPLNGGRAPYKPSGQYRAAHNATYGTDAWGEYSYIWDAADWQAGVKFFRPEFLSNYGGTAGHWDVQGLVIEEATDVEAAKDAASAAQTAANTANAALADIAADNKLTPGEKRSVRVEWDAIYAERASIQAQASSFSITTELTNYNNDFQALGTYLNGGTAYTIGAAPPSWITDANLAVTTNIVGSTFRTNWATLYQRRQELLNKISAEAAKRADWSSVGGKTGFAALDGKITSGNVTTYIDYAAIGAAQIGSVELVGESAFKVRTNNSAGARMDMDSRRIKIFDANGTLRVQLGDLTV